MAKAKFTIDLNDPEDQSPLKVFANWRDFHFSAWELKWNMNAHFKHKDWNEEQQQVYEEVREWIDQTFEDTFKHLDQ
jgi:hypothetical protein